MEDRQLDAILVNETNLLWNSRDPKMPGYTLHRTERRDGTAIYVRKKIKQSSSYVPDLRQLKAMAVTVVTARGPLRLIACYNNSNTLQVEDIADLVAGDFNAKHSDWHSRQNKVNGRRLLTFLRNTAEVDVISIEEPTFYHRARSDAPGDVLDIALVKNLRHEVDVTVVDELHCDHFPVIMRIGNEPNDPAANIITTTDWTKFAEHFKENFGEFVTNFQDSEQVERPTLDYENRIQASINATSVRRPVRPFKRPAIPQRIANLIREKNRARRYALRTGEQADRTAANHLQWEVRQALLNLRNEQWEQRLESLNTVDGLSWKMAKALRTGRRPLPPIHSANNGIVFTDEDKAAAFAHSLENQCQTNIDPDADDEHLDLVEETAEEIRWTEPDKDELIRGTHPEETREIIRLLKPRKAPGTDGIPNKALKNLSDEAIVALAGIINAMFKFLFFPARWKEAHVIFIPKPGKNHIFPENHRPISLLSSVGEISERVIRKRLAEIVNDLGVIPDEQFGFRPQHSTSDQLLRVVEFAAKSIEWKQLTGAVFLDVAKAFDTVWHDGLVYYKLHLAGVPLAMVHLIQSFLDDRTFKARIGHALSAEHPISE
ncbi:hypothetical protein Zmor_021482 [Zophobas morio]|uniref:Reverse transcriptase domain-containing protein n=1 Tax=Zophobas morio TaxID=2755281 RepID=A0AA38I6F6_9CUCU|nr:hypothetical protein Zmor_021482 [Zophobas morio]